MIPAMLRAIARVVIALVANAVGLIAAAWILDDMSLSVSGFLIDVAIFTGIQVVSQPLIIKQTLRGGSALSGASALLAAFVALLLTTWISDGLTISCGTTWLLATVIVWAASLLATLLLPLVLFKKTLQAAKAR
jgi:putative membrane protein